MPRKSLAALSTPLAVNVSRIRLTPPAWLSPAAANVFRTLVAAVDPQHFRRSDLPLLCAYSAAVVAHDRAVQALEAEGAVTAEGKVSPWITIREKEVRALVPLARSLRLSPQARMNSTQASRNSEPRGSVFDLHKLDGEDERVD